VDTTAVILAVASPPGRSLRGIVRASGPACFELLETVLDCLDRSRGVRPGRLNADGLDLACLALFSPAPRSYTGEASVELQLPGNPPLLDRVIDALLASGRLRGIAARRAEPGEFTARAYLNGRMSLTQAEGVAATIAARSDAQLRAAGLLSAGRLATMAHELAEKLAQSLALVEAGIDFTDQDDVVAIGPDDLFEQLVLVRDRVDSVLAHAVGSEQLEAIPWVVLAGPANAGKSTLFNALLGHRRAVVSDVAGTTRDVLTEPLTIDTPHGPAEVMLVDIAGADGTAGDLDQLMQDAATRAINRADLVIRCARGGLPAPQGNEIPIHVDTLTDTRLDELRHRIAERLADRAVSLSADALALGPRHEAALTSAQRNLRDTLDLVEPIRGERTLPQPELVAAGLRMALDDLAGLAGDVTPDDILGRIFATFCVGK
jgi:tRNA modification GTPase